MEYRTNTALDDGPQPVASFPLSWNGIVLSHPVFSPSLAVDRDRNKVFASFALAFRPNFPFSYPTEFYTFEAQKSENGWSIEGLETEGFAVTSTAYSDFVDFRFNQTKLSPEGAAATTFYNGTIGDFGRAQIKFFKALDLPAGLPMHLLEAIRKLREPRADTD